MTRIAAWLAVASVVLLSVILAIGEGGADGAVFHLAIEMLPFCLIPSGLVFALVFWRLRHRALATLFVLNLAAYVVIAVLLLMGREPARPVMFIIDVLQLNLYLLTLARHWELLNRGETVSAPGRANAGVAP